jgi:hypothetical protein
MDSPVSAYDVRSFDPLRHSHYQFQNELGRRVCVLGWEKAMAALVERGLKPFDAPSIDNLISMHVAHNPEVESETDRFYAAAVSGVDNTWQIWGTGADGNLWEQDGKIDRYAIKRKLTNECEKAMIAYMRTDEYRAKAAAAARRDELRSRLDLALRGSSLELLESVVLFAEEAARG